MIAKDLVCNAFAASGAIISTKFTIPPRDFKRFATTECKSQDKQDINFMYQVAT